jgi:hypothetical protein
LHESASGVSFRDVDWFTTNDVPIDAVEVPEIRWRAKDKPSEQGLMKDEDVSSVYAVCVYVVGPDLS